MISLPRDRMDQLVKRFDMLEAQMAAGPDPEFDGDEPVVARRIVYRVRLGVPNIVGSPIVDLALPAAELYVDVSDTRLRARFVGSHDARQPGGSLRRAQRASGIGRDRPVPVEPPEVRTDRGRLPGDGGTGEAAGVEVGEVAAQHPVVQPLRGDRAPLQPRDELVDVVGVRRARVLARPRLRGREAVRRPLIDGHGPQNLAARTVTIGHAARVRACRVRRA